MQSILDEILREIKELKESVKAKRPSINDIAVITQYNLINNILREKLLSKRMSRKIIRIVIRNLHSPNQLILNTNDTLKIIEREIQHRKSKTKNKKFIFPKGSVT